MSIKGAVQVPLSILFFKKGGCFFLKVIVRHRRRTKLLFSSGAKRISPWKK